MLPKKAIVIPDFLKKYFLSKGLSKNKVVRNHQVISLQKARNIGIICEITDEDSYKEIMSIFNSLQNTNKNLWLIGYVNDKSVPFYCLQQLSADYFCNKDLTWYGKPNKVQIDDFIKKEFDMLIDLSPRAYNPVQYILHLSAASFIVGSVKENAKYYDLHICNDDAMDRVTLIENINTYTQKLAGESHDS